MSAILLGIIGAALMAANQVPGVEGFAQRSDVTKLQVTADQLQASNKDIEARIIAQDIYEARKEQCKAMRENDTAAKPATLRRLEALRADYDQVTGHEYRLPDCSEI